MLRPELCAIHPNDHDGWAAFATTGHSEPWDEFAWFVLDVGLAGRIGTIAFQVLAATPAAVGRARGKDRDRRVLVVESFEPKALEAALWKHVAAAAAPTWDEIVERLRRHMYWEYEKQWS